MEINLKPKLTTYRTFQGILHLNRESAGPLFLIFQRISVYVFHKLGFGHMEAQFSYEKIVYYHHHQPGKVEIDHISRVES